MRDDERSHIPRERPRAPRERDEGDAWARGDPAAGLAAVPDPALADRTASVAEIDRELEAAIEYKLATGEDAVGEILDMFARAVERRRLGLSSPE